MPKNRTMEWVRYLPEVDASLLQHVERLNAIGEELSYLHRVVLDEIAKKWTIEQRVEAARRARDEKDLRPRAMILTCPSCKERHIDEGEFATKSHHTHACQHCGTVWRPAIIPTIGVRFLPGFKNP